MGLGFDVHPSAPGRPLLLGGVLFEGESGLAGHSDGDVVCHSVGDALLGAAALGDLGDHFPDDDPDTEGLAGRELLGRVVSILGDAGFRADGCDVTVVAHRPAVGPRRQELRSALSRILGLDVARVSVKATRPEGLGLSGDGIGCLAIATIVPA